MNHRRPDPFLAFLALLLCCATAAASPQMEASSQQPITHFASVMPADIETGISSDAEMFLSLRYMRHLWRADPDHLVAVVQQGDYDDNNLALYKSLDEGTTWALEQEDLSSSPFAVSDGIMPADGILLLVTSFANTGPTEDVQFLRLVYNPVSLQWSADPPTTVFDSTPDSRATGATIAMDSNGVLWCAFRLESEGTFKIALYSSTDAGATWEDSLNVLGTPNGLEDKSAKVLAAGNRIFVIYQDVRGIGWGVQRYKKWAYREDSQPVSDPLTSPDAFIAKMHADGGDPLGSHWSVAADPAGNLHLTYQDGWIKYIRYDAASAAWAPFPEHLGTPSPSFCIVGSYNSVSAAGNGDPYVLASFTNPISGKSRVFVRSMAGQTWTPWSPVSPPSCEGLLRMCSPEGFDDVLPVIYQVNELPPYDLHFCLLGSYP